MEGLIKMPDGTLDEDGTALHNLGDGATEAELAIEVTRLLEEYKAQEYKELRRQEYPTIEEVIHAILDNDMDALQAKRALVKAKFPKGI